MKDVKIYEVDLGGEFKKNARRLTRKKKFYSLPDQIDELVTKFENGNFDFGGDELFHSDTPTPYSIYKMRLPNPDTGAGKSNGYRIIYMVVSVDSLVVLLTVYYKKEIQDVTDEYVKALADGYFLSLLTEEEE